MAASSTSNRITVALVIATAMAIPFEGFREKYYYDPPGILSVCYGYTGADIDKSKTYSLEECKKLLDKDMLYAVSVVDKCRPGLPINVLAAFADATYNIGPNIACNRSQSTAARKLAVGDYASACRELPRWNKARVAGVMVPLEGLTNRRNAEMHLCLSGLQ